MLPIVVLSGAGLSAPSGIPTFRGPGGWWRNHDARQIATPEAWAKDPDLVLEYHEERLKGLHGVRPNDGHRALAQMQARYGADQVLLITQNVDGLIQAAGYEIGFPTDVVEIHGSLHWFRCSASRQHPRTPAIICGGVCDVCGSRMRPDVVWFGEMPQHLDRVYERLEDCATFLSVGTSGLVDPAAEFVGLASRAGAVCIDINPEPSCKGPFDLVLPEGAEVALPRLLRIWEGQTDPACKSE